VTENELKKAQEEQQRAAEVLMQKTQVLASIAAERKSAAEAELAEATKNKQEIDAQVTAIQEKLKRINEQATPRDTAEIILSEPVNVRVLAP
jgi:chromosome segregation ATPase